MDIQSVIFNQVFDIIKTKLQEPRTPSVPGTEARVANELTKEIAPIIVNQTNNEPLWKSRVLRGALVAILGLAGGYLGLQFTDADLDQVVKAGGDIATGLGVLYAIYGRLTAKGTPKI